MIPYRLPALGDKKIDVLILDVCVNEQRAVSRNLYDLNQSTQYLAFLSAWCRARKIMPVILILPVRLAGNSASKASVRDHWRRICTAAGVPYFDGYAFAGKARAALGLPTRSLFKDDYHFTPEASVLLARMLARRLSLFRAKARMKLKFGLVHDFRYVTVAGDVERATSLVRERFRRLELGDEITVDCGAGQVIGVVLNMAQTNGSIQMRGRETAIKRLDSRYFNPDRGMWLVAWSILKPISAKAGRISIRTLASRLDAAFEDNDHTKGKLPSEDTPPVVELAGLVIRGRRSLKRLYCVSGVDLDLMAIVPRAR